MAFGLIALKGRGGIKIERKIACLAKILHDDETIDAAVNAEYEKVGRELPKNPKARYTSWRQDVIRRGRAGDVAVVAACKEENIFQEVSDPMPRAVRRARAKRTA